MEAYAASFAHGAEPVGVEPLELGGEPFRVAGDERFAQLRLTGEVVVQARLGDAELRRHVGVAEAVESARLHETLGGVEDARSRTRPGRASSPPLRG